MVLSGRRLDFIMFIHLGGDVAITGDEFIAVIDISAIRRTPTIDEYLTAARAKGTLVDLSDGIPKAIVITRDKVYLSPISPVTLKRRAEGLVAVTGDYFTDDSETGDSKD